VCAYADRVVACCAGEVTAEHARSFGWGHTIYDPWHYLFILAREPGDPTQRDAVAFATTEILFLRVN
jgi:hypothetical protein